MHVTISNILFGIFIFSVIIQVFYWFYMFNVVWNRNSQQKHTSAQLSVNLIIAARNEINNLKSHLSSWLKQENINVKIIICDDRSTDETGNWLSDISNKNEHVQYCQISHGSEGGKKRALQKAIENSTEENLLFTDADCFPGSESWAEMMISMLENEKQIVIGYGPYQKLSGTLNKWIRFETFITAIQYSSMALRGMPYMGVGRNLAYKKELFVQNNGFSNHLQLKSGDDDLFVSEVATNKNVAVQLDPDTFVYSKPETGWGAYFKQKRRHLTTGKYYPTKTKLILSAFFISHIGFFGSIILLTLYGFATFSILAMVIRWLILILLNKKYLHIFREGDLLQYIPLLDIGLLFYYIIFSPFVFIKSKLAW